jgi:hypothetical protein
MDAGMGFLLIVGVTVLVARTARGPGPAGVLAGLFKSTCDLGWPTGVQEDDTIRPWGAPARPQDPDHERAAIEDLATPGCVTTHALAHVSGYAGGHPSGHAGGD